MLTTEQVRNAFRNAIPARQGAFKLVVADANRTRMRRSDMKTWYPQEVLRLAKEEARVRLSMAADKVRALIDSGWDPDPMHTIRSVFGDMFSAALGMDKDPYTDLNNAIEHAVFEVSGLSPSDQPHERKSDPLCKEHNTCWFDTTEEFIGELECYIPQRGTIVSSNYNFSGNVGVVQTGGTSHVTQSFGMSAQELVTALAALQQVVRQNGGTDADDIDVLVSEVTLEASVETPNRGKIASLLNGAAQTIQTIAAAPGAWNLVAAAATAFTGHPIHTLPIT